MRFGQADRSACARWPYSVDTRCNWRDTVCVGEQPKFGLAFVEYIGQVQQVGARFRQERR
jgi:hypothetical protein